MFTFFRQPLTRQAAPRNAVLAHIIAAAVGLAALFAFNLYEHPSVLEEGVTLARIFAAASSMAITEALLVLLRLPHTPAGTTSAIGTARAQRFTSCHSGREYLITHL